MLARRGPSVALLGFVVGFVCGLGTAVAFGPSEALASANANWATGVEAVLPAGVATNPNLYLDSVSCASAGNCSAVGYYTDSSGHSQGVLLAESAGTWATGVAASLPANAGSDPGVSPNSVSCASAGNCSAVGY